jgi:hypothetical protein
MDSLFNLGIIVMLICIVLSRIISEKAHKNLTSEQKVSLIDSFSEMRKYNLLPLAVIFIVFIFAKYLKPALGMSFYIIFLIAILSFLVGLQIIVFRKLKRLEMPKSYTKIYVLSKIIVLSGFTFWIGTMIYPLFGSIG